MIWYIADIARYKREQAVVSELEREVDWLVGAHWRIDTSLRLCFDFEIVLGEHTKSLTLRYGTSFPAAPPTVFPRTPERLSDHQYGEADLCLEFGPDTWRDELTGADQIRSAHRLLVLEDASVHDPLQVVSSRHAVTVGQATRESKFRFLATSSLVEALRDAPRGVVGRASFARQYNGFSWVYFPAIISGLAEEPWTDHKLPEPFLKPSSLDNGLVFGLTSGVALPRFGTRKEIEDFLGPHGYVTPGDRTVEALDLLLVYSDSDIKLLWSIDDGDAGSMVTIRSHQGQRLGVAHTVLSTKKVGLVGCGSVGSKMAAMLARAGVRHFVLVDDDVFLPENIVRNELTWTDVGHHKADALSKRLELVSPGVKCICRKHRLGGQESNTGADSALFLLQSTDLIIDATANGSVFNVVSAAATSASKPMIWSEVFEGGIGGLIARSRPSLDPSPQTVRACIDSWCADQGVAAPRPAGDYATETGDGVLLIADDADVSAIAAHAARFAIDILMDRSPSSYPSSAYLIGLSPDWLFGQPFVTFPIDCGAVTSLAPQQTVERDPETLDTILKLISERSDQASDPS